MGQCLALLGTTASSTDRGEDLKIDPDGRIPKRAKSNDQTINPWTFGTPQFSALAKCLIPFTPNRCCKVLFGSDLDYLAAAATVSPGGKIRNMKVETFSPGLNGPGVWLLTGFKL